HRRSCFAGLGLPGGLLVLIGFGLFAGIQAERVLIADAGEEGLQPVVVAVQDGVKFVVVAAGAAVGQAQENRTDGVSNVVEDLLAAENGVGQVAFVRPGAVEAGGNLGGRVARIQLVAGDLLPDEAV